MESSISNIDHFKDLGEKTRLIIDAALEAIVGIDTNGDIIMWNPQAEVIFGWKKAEVLGTSLKEKIVPKRFRQKLGRVYELYQHTGSHVNFNKIIEFSAIDRNGKEFPIELSVLPIKEKGHEFFCAFIRDISERKQADQVLMQQKEFSETLINSLPGSFYLFDITGKFLLWNKNFYEVAEYSEEEIKEMTPLNFFEAKEHNRISESIQKVFVDGKADIEAQVITKSGKKIPYYFTGKFIEIGGNPCVMGMGVDISERVKLQQELDKKTTHQQRKMTKAVIAAQEAERTQLGQELHDNVNQVLTTIKLYTEMLRDGLGDSGTIIEKSIYHLQRCINEIRSISKKLSAPTLGNLSLVESIKELAESINLTKRINIIFNIEGFLKKDITREIHLALYRIVQEELNNIIKYAEASYVAISLKRENQYLTLTIKDDGKGFDIKSNKGGNGLYNMKTRAENIGGTFTIISTVGSGCEIIVGIPIFENTGEK